MKLKESYHRLNPTWCKGCGLFGVFDAVKRAAAAVEVEDWSSSPGSAATAG
jgi:pyruvate/2-oxoacid:ferredoxin oxidoreductase beta subunit